MDDGKPHEKRFVVLDCSGDLAVSAVFNSEIHPLIQKNQAAMKCQVECSPLYDFVTKTCFLDCSRVRKYPMDEVLEQLTADPTRILGDIDGQLRDQICAGLKASVSVRPVDLTLCLTSLEGIEYPELPGGAGARSV